MWFRRNWRKVAIAIAAAISMLAGGHTIAKKVADKVPEIVEKVPCTPGEIDCPNGK